LRVLADAQPSFVAWKSQIKIIRPSHEKDKRRVMTINADRIMKEGKLDQNVLLQEGDILYVPPTPLAWLAFRVREIIYPFTPAVGGLQAGSGGLAAPTAGLAFTATGAGGI
jgi:hypothetical protein